MPGMDGKSLEWDLKDYANVMNGLFVALAHRGLAQTTRA